MQYATNVSLWKRLLDVLSVGLEYFLALALVPSPWPWPWTQSPWKHHWLQFTFTGMYHSYSYILHSV